MNIRIDIFLSVMQLSAISDRKLGVAIVASVAKGQPSSTYIILNGKPVL